MPRLTPFAGLGLALVLSACAASDGMNAVATGGCGASTHESLIGTSVTDLNPDMFPADTRFNFPGAATGDDVNPDRLNFSIGTDDTVKSVYCG